MRNFTKSILTSALLVFGLSSAMAGEEKEIFSWDYAAKQAHVDGFWGAVTPTFDEDGLVLTQTAKGSSEWDNQFFIANHLIAQTGYTYKVSVLMAASTDAEGVEGGHARICMGAWGGTETVGGFDFTLSDEFKEYTFTYEKAEDEDLTDAHVLWQSAFFVGTVKIKKVTVYEIAPDVPVEEPDWADILTDESIYEKIYPSSNPTVAYTDGDGIYAFESPAKVSEDWDTQFWIVTPKYLPAGTKFRVSFEYKATEETTVQSQFHEKPGNYLSNGIGDVNFTTTWQPLLRKGSVPASCDGSARENSSYTNSFGSIAFNLTKSTSIIYYIRNVKFEIDQAVADELEITTGIQDVNATTQSDAIFDLQGRRVAQPQKGLYIVNGKKMLMK